jgi:hypothetical protein
MNTINHRHIDISLLLYLKSIHRFMSTIDPQDSSEPDSNDEENDDDEDSSNSGDHSDDNDDANDEEIDSDSDDIKDSSHLSSSDEEDKDLDGRNGNNE